MGKERMFRNPNECKNRQNPCVVLKTGSTMLKALPAAVLAGAVFLGVPSVGAAESVAVAAENTEISTSDNTDTNKGLVTQENDLGTTLEAKEDSFALGQSGSGLMATQNGIVTGFAVPEVLGDEGTVEFLQEKPIDTPTLDYLHENNVKIPQKTVDSSGNLIDGGTPILAPESGYSLTEVETAGDNVITKYEVVEVTRYYDKTTGEFVSDPVDGGDYKVVQEKDLVPHYYKVNTSIPELEVDLGTSSSITWTEVEEAGDNTVSVSLPNGTGNYQYTYTTPEGYDTTTYSGLTNDLGTITNPRGDYWAHRKYVGGVLYNPSGTTTTLEGYLFKDNKTTAIFTSTISYNQYADLLGGAIYNAGEITKITADFVGNGLDVTTNRTDGTMDGYAMGGAIANVGTIGDIIGDFIKNSSGAIYNSGTIGDITGDFVNNSDGAIYNAGSKATIGDITGDFVNNSDGAIYNAGSKATIGDITGDFVNNSDGAIYNDGSKATIGDITGDFIGNYQDKGYNVHGGAIYNRGTIGDITGNFVNNYGVSEQEEDDPQDSAEGGAICNYAYNSSTKATIGDITGDFIGNYVQGMHASGGAIYNEAYSGSNATIGDITGDFIGNYADSYYSNYGGAIYNTGTVGNITGNFIANYTDSINETKGGAIYNRKTIGDITSDFIGNYAQGWRSYGGAIYNAAYSGSKATIGNITGDFIGNYANGSSYAYGGAIYNSYNATIGNITGDFIDNYANGSSYAYGGAIYNYADYSNAKATIGNITGDFIGNYAKGSSAEGGAIYNDADGSGSKATIGDITGDFIGNYAQSTSAPANGGAIYNYANSSNSTARIGDITGDFIGNYAQSTSSNAYGGAIHNYANSSSTATIGDITGDFIGNYAQSTSYYAEGGAIYNSGTIGDITGDFIGNYATSNVYAEGGAINNYANSSNSTAIIGDITGDFIGNYAQGRYAKGGAIYNYNSTIGNITGDFIGNYAKGPHAADGGAIYNDAWSGTATIGDITGDFIGNYAVCSSYSAYGGAISNEAYQSSSTATIGDITGDFIGNYATSNDYAYGGAIYNYARDSSAKVTIGAILGDFIGNYAQSTSSSARGGAISNEAYLSGSTATIGNITGDFIGNYAQSSSFARGGAIYNSGTIGDITGDFISNSVTAGTYAIGGAILNSGTIGDITGDFIGNSVTAGTWAQGGAIRNDGTITSIIGNFINNTVTAGNDINGGWGGAIRNKGIISLLQGDFIANYTQSEQANAYGGAIYNTGTISEIVNSNFVNNYAMSKTADAQGGAIWTNTDITIKADNRTSEFTGNYVQVGDGDKDYQAIWVDSSSAILTLKTVNNGNIILNDYIDGTSGYAVKLTGDSTGKIQLNNGIRHANVTLDNTTLHLGVTDSENNKSDVLAQSNVTVNSGIVDTVDGKYTNYTIGELNSSEDARYSIDMVLSSDEQKSDTFTLTEGGSGTVYLSSINVIRPAQDDNNRYVIQIIKSETDNAPQLAYDDSKLLSQASASMSNDMIFADEFGLYTTHTTNDSLAIKNLRDVFSEWANLDTTEDKTFTFVNGSNYTLSLDSALKGEIISIVGLGNNFDVNNKEFLDNVASNQKVSISGLNIVNSNQVNNNGELTLQNSTLSADIINSGTLNLQNKTSAGNITNNSDVVVLNLEKNSTVESVSGSGNLTVQNSEVTFNSGLSGQNISAEDSTMTLNTPSMASGNSLSMSNSTLNTLSLGLNNLHFNDLSLINSNINIESVDVDLANATMGRISADNYGEISGNINVNGLNIISETSKLSLDILFADNQLADKVTYNGAKQIAYSPIYKYDVSYKQSNSDGLGYFNFIRSGIGSNNSSDGFNPSVVATPVASQTGATATMNQTFNYAFQNSSNFMNIPYLERIAIKNANKYALSPTGNATDVGTYSPIFTKNDDASVWVKPYASFENIPLKNGPKVSNITYGTLVGFDTQLIQMKHGWDRVWTGYIGYNGASQRYSGVNSTQNGGLLGGTLTLYKGNFFNATTISAGASVAENTNMYGHENFSMLLAGVGNKAGYNFEFKEGKIIIQPSLLMSYTFVNTFDYTNAAGVRIKSDPLHSIQLSPGVKFIGNTKNGWQPYIGVNMVWNILDKSNVHANDVKLPEMSIKPYVQYGVGVQKRFKDNCMAFGQAMIQSGGRNGISLTAGFRWSLGKEGKAIKDNEKVMIPDTSETIFNDRRNAHVNRVSDSQPKRTVLKQLTPKQKVSLGAKPQNTTRTTSRAILKQL